MAFILTRAPRKAPAKGKVHQLRHRLLPNDKAACGTDENPLSYAAFNLKVTCKACLAVPEGK